MLPLAFRRECPFSVLLISKWFYKMWILFPINDDVKLPSQLWPHSFYENRLLLSSCSKVWGWKNFAYNLNLKKGQFGQD